MKIVRKLMFAAAILSPLAAVAAEPETPSVTGNFNFASDYRFRGISQTFKQPAVQGGFDYVRANGFYLGTWGSNVSGNQYLNGGSMEWDLYGGYKFEPVKDLKLDVGAYAYYYPGARYNAAGDKYDTTELYVGASYQWFSAKYSSTLSNYFGVKTSTYGGYCGIRSDGTTGTDCLGANPGDSRGSGYLDLNASFDVAEKLTLGLHVGHQTVRHYGKLDYTDYKVGLIKDYRGFLLGAAVVTTDAKADLWRVQNSAGQRKDVRDTGLVLSVGKTL